MKNKSFLPIVLSVAAIVTGCNREPTAAQQMDKLKADTKAAVQDMADYTYSQKAEFTIKMQAQLAEIKTDLDQLEAKIEKSSDKVKADATPKLKALRQQESELKQQLEAVKDSNESTWESVKAASRKTAASIKDGFQQSRQWLSDKIAP
ncbi:MAG TPA: hypothetical protein VK968_03170 [Roseimicrobium sp.]|nr:hypothetical protein [Roseimicrobium sp.]